MKKYFIVILVAFFALSPFVLYAQTTSSTEKINARILPILWYSDLNFSDGNNLKIYSAIQNNSGFNFSGEAFFYVDDQNIYQIPFNSSSGVLESISAPWVAQSGTHTIVVKITTNLSSDKTLVSYESDKSSIFIPKTITANDIKQGVTDVASGFVGIVNNLTDSLAQKIASTKIVIAKTTDETAKNSVNTSANNLAQSSGGTDSSKVVSVSSVPILSNQVASVFNAGLNGLIFLLHNWIWTAGVILVLALYLKLRS